MATLLFADIETTGLRPDRGARITEIAIVDRGRVPLHWIGNPEEEDYEATLATQLRITFRRLCNGVVVGHNLSFDLSFLAYEAERLDMEGPRLRYIDTLALARQQLGRTKDVRLSALASYLGCTVNPEVLHTALGDAHLTRDVFWRLVERGGLHTLADAGVQPLRWGT